MDQAAERVAAAIRGLTEEQLTGPDLDGWSVKDHLAHMTVWHEWRFFELSRIARGGQAGFPQIQPVGGVDPVDELNELFTSQRRGVPLAQVLSDLDFAREMLREALSTAPEDRLADQYYAEMGPNGAGHDVAHAEVIEAWRKSKGMQE
jgi:hypothetical protein